MRATSIYAWESVRCNLTPLHVKIMQGMEKIEMGTFRDISLITGLRESQVWKRLSELERQGLLTADKVIKCRISNRLVTVWKIVKK